MTQNEFENILNECCSILTSEAQVKKFLTSKEFENRVRQILANLTQHIPSVEIDFNPKSQAFPDIAIGEFGVEVKFTANDSWRSVANSVLETQRIESVKYIYIVFGKMGGDPEARWKEYEKSVIHVRTSHVPRFEVEIKNEDENQKACLFEEMGISYDDFRKLPMSEKMRYIRAYAKKMHPNERLWWIEDADPNDSHTIPINVRLYTNLAQNEKFKLRAEAVLLCPSVVKSRGSKKKYDDAVLYLLTYHGVLCHQTRDLFTAGSVANPSNDDDGGLYLARSLKLLEQSMIEAAATMDDALFVEYWGESAPPSERIKRWLQKADELATDWVPSSVLFTDYQS